MKQLKKEIKEIVIQNFLILLIFFLIYINIIFQKQLKIILFIIFVFD